MTVIRPPWLTELNPHLPAIIPEAPVPTPNVEVPNIPLSAPPSTLPPVKLINPLKQEPETVVPTTMLPFVFDATKFNAGTLITTPQSPMAEDSPFAGLFSKKEVEPEDDINQYIFNASNTVEPGTEIPFVMPEPIPTMAEANNVVIEEPPQLPIKRLALEANAPWLSVLSRDASVAYDNHIEQINKVAPIHAAKLLLVKGYNSAYVGLIDTPALAEQHIRQCEDCGEDIKGWNDAYHRQVKKGQSALMDGMRIIRKQEDRLRYFAAVAAAREAWKEAIAEKNRQIEILSNNVSALHDAYIDIKDLGVDGWHNENVARGDYS